jgi:hypothetical protein
LLEFEIYRIDGGIILSLNQIGAQRIYPGLKDCINLLNVVGGCAF